MRGSHTSHIIWSDDDDDNNNDDDDDENDLGDDDDDDDDDDNDVPIDGEDIQVGTSNVLYIHTLSHSLVHQQQQHHLHR